jgi:hypothetical protein
MTGDPSKPNANETVGALLNSVHVPGEDVLKTLGAALLSLLMIVLTNDTPLYSLDSSAASLMALRQTTLLVLLLSIGFFVISAGLATVLRLSPCSLVRSYWQVYSAKYSLDLGLVLLFGAVGAWVISLGGITRSPFACILSLTPAIFLITCLRDRKKDYEAVFSALEHHLTIKQAPAQHAAARRTSRILGVIPLVAVGLTMTLGQCLVARLALHDRILPPPGTVAKVAATQWYVEVYYTIFFLSVGLAFYGGLWSHVNFTKKLSEAVQRKFP